MHRRRTIARTRRVLTVTLALAFLAALAPPGAAAAPEKRLSLNFTEELLSRIATDSQGEQSVEIVDRILGLSPALLNARLQRASGRVSLFLTTSADEDVPLDFQLTLDKMAYYRMRTARTDAAGMTQALLEAKSFEPLLLDVSYRHDGRYAVIDCTLDLRPTLAAARQARERREAAARAAAEAQAAAAAKAVAETRSTAALKAAATAKAAVQELTKEAARAASPAPGAAVSPVAPAAAPPPAAAEAGPPPAGLEGHLSAKALGREVEPLVDGLFSDAAWLGAERFTFEVRGASGKFAVSAWALWSPERVWLMLRWPDRSRDDAHHPWVWSKEAKSYIAGRETEDEVALAFAREGRMGECMLAGRASVSDLWTWRAGRTDPTGFAEDGTLTVRLQSFAGASPQATPAGGTAWVKDEPDAGAGPYEAQPAGAFAGDRVASYLTRTPSGSAGDVAAKGFWKDGHWLVEFSRRLYTGDPADAVLTPGRETYLSIAVFNAREGADHSTSQEI
ncbi:MAG TPA: ethylbenzene dehydrogenase-related protein, partial [Candidatus Methanoperedens sp.]|nr:ethylbenzene dehydrogenase-related protein [Candidatus Methanoperedens sp.]